MKPFKKLRTAVIGVGAMGVNHARILSEISNLIAVVDKNKAQGLEIGRKYGAKWYDNHKELIGKVDAVCIAVPTEYHFKVASDLLDSQINMLVEKPIASNILEAKKLINLSKKNDIILSVGHIERYNPIVQSVKTALSDNSLGNLFSISAKRFSPNPVRISDVGVILDLSVHDIDIMNYFFGEYPVSVYCNASFRNENDNESHVSILLDYGKGKVGLCETSWHSSVKVRDLVLLSDKYYMTLDLLNQCIKSPIAEDLEKNNQDLLSIAKCEPLRLELFDFLSSVEESKQPLVGGEDGLLALKIATAALDSIKLNKVIKL